jgi:rubrerythrin
VSQGERKLSCHQLCEGRRPEGLAGQVFQGSDLGAFFARMAHLEAASVASFRILHRELTKFGAPRSLRHAARRAARDEIRHARMARALARSHGGKYVAPRIAPPAERSLEAVAIENVVEGCVRETYGALAATFHAESASDPSIRKAMRSIARDETRHAALSWRIFRWANRRLSLESRRRVLAERDRASRALIDELGYGPPPSVVATAGAPRASVARELARALTDALGPGS